MWLIRVLEALMWHVGANGPLQFACFVSQVRHVIILQRTVYFKFRLIHVHMYA